jgi:enamine deaminase RidA (YjgF/YER057c/UK114 family)
MRQARAGPLSSERMIYVVSEDREDLAAVWRVVQEESDVADAASTLLGVSLLGYEGQLVEIEALAVLE